MSNNHEEAGTPVARPTREEAEEAVRTLIRWAGDDPARGLYTSLGGEGEEMVFYEADL